MKISLLAAATALALLSSASVAWAQDTTSEKGKISYALGYRAGLDVARVTAAGEPLDMATVMRAFQDATSGKDPAVSPELLGPAMQALQARMVAKAKAQMDSRAAANKTQGEAFLAQNRAKAGVASLPSGVQYQVIEAGSGAKPKQADQITVEFKSTLPDGTVIADTSVANGGQPASPVTVRLSEIPLPGLREALQAMPAGARWNVVIPGKHAHGENVEQAGEMANQVVIFNIKLVSVVPAAAAPGG